MDTKRNVVLSGIACLVVLASLIPAVSATSDCPAGRAWPVTCACRNGGVERIFDSDALRLARIDPTSCCYQQYMEWTITPRSFGSVSLDYSLFDVWKARLQARKNAASAITNVTLQTAQQPVLITFGGAPPATNGLITFGGAVSVTPVEQVSSTLPKTTQNTTQYVPIIPSKPYTITYIPSG